MSPVEALTSQPSRSKMKAGRPDSSRGALLFCVQDESERFVGLTYVEECTEAEGFCLFTDQRELDEAPFYL